jgi:hypothetical protein
LKVQVSVSGFLQRSKWASEAHNLPFGAQIGGELSHKKSGALLCRVRKAEILDWPLTNTSRELSQAWLHHNHAFETSQEFFNNLERSRDYSITRRDRAIIQDQEMIRLSELPEYYL